MKRKWLSLIALVMVAVMCTPVIALGGTNIFYVDTANKKSLNMRSDCTMGDNIIASIPYRAEVTVYEFLAGDAWARVEYNGLMGFVMTRYLSGTRPPAAAAAAVAAVRRPPRPFPTKALLPRITPRRSSPPIPRAMSTCAGPLPSPPPFMRCTMPETCCR